MCWVVGDGRVTLVDRREAVDDPVTTAQRTVESLRGWVALDRDAHLLELAAAVNNLAVDLSEAARPNEALAAAREAVELYRELFSTDRDTRLFIFVISMSNFTL
jgi:hypothetical protein